MNTINNGKNMKENNGSRNYTFATILKCQAHRNKYFTNYSHIKFKYTIKNLEEQ